jgi:hypothetical protein
MKKIFFPLVLVWMCASAMPTQAQWLWDVHTLKVIKSELNTPSYAGAYARLLDDADRALQQKPWSVTFKQLTPGSGDKHDYASLSRYYWPNPDTADGLPYIYRDGQSNPELDKYDRNRLGEMCQAVNTLALAWFYSGDERYDAKAVEFLRVWFLNPDTRMNPNLNYAQFVPNRKGSRGNPSGVIDSYSFVEMLNSVELLRGSQSLTKKDLKALKSWFTQLSEWLVTSDNGKRERAATNNHGTTFDLQLSAYLTFTGQVDSARQIIEAFPTRRMFPHIEPDGRQLRELTRTLAFHYSEYNLGFMLDMLFLAKSLDLELYKMQSPDGRSFYKAVDFLAQYLGKSLQDWPYQQISGWDAKQQDLCNLLYRITTLDPSRQDYVALYRKYSQNPRESRLYLCYGHTIARPHSR